MDHEFFSQAFVYLAAAVLIVPLAKKLGMGSVLGYLLSGIIIGPYVLGLCWQGRAGHYACGRIRGGHDAFPGRTGT